MGEQDGTHSSTNQRRSRKTSTAKQQNGKQTPAAQRPANNDTEAWKAYWKQQGQPWRTEPEIDAERQKYLDERRGITPNIEQGIYPFKDIKLSRAAVEWLLATHENGRGPIDWNDGSQRSRTGLDVRGADLSHVDLRYLPLTKLKGSLTAYEWRDTTEEPCNRAAVLMEGTDLRWVHLENADFRWAQCEKVRFRLAHLDGCNFWGAHLERAYLGGAYLRGARLRRAHLEEADFKDAVLSDEKHIGPLMADARWNNVNFTVMDWSQVEMIGDEYEARQKTHEGKMKERKTSIDEYERAVRANRQLAAILQAQGLNEVAARFAYRAQVLQREVLWLQHDFGHWLFSMLLAILSGYGYRIWRILTAYIALVSLFALAYFVLGMYFSPHLHLDQAYLESITAFHGRVFLEQFSTHTPQIWLTALEAIAGLIIEGVFIAMLIQRFFGK